MKNVRRIVILYPGETSSERLNKPANYSLSRLLLRLHSEGQIPIHFFNTSPIRERYGNIEFIPFSKPAYVRCVIRLAMSTRTLIISQMNSYYRYALFMRSLLPNSRLLVRLGGVYYGRKHLDSASFQEEIDSYLHYLRSADMVLSTADGTPVDYFMERVGVPRNRYRKWLNGFPEIPNMQGYRRGNRIVCISRLSSEKGIDCVVRSFALALPRLREPHTLTIVGDGPDRASLEQLASELGVRSSVEFVGDSFDIARYLYTSKLLVSGLANNPIMEAIATGTPVITVELGEIASLYGHYPNVHVMDYPPGGCGRIDQEHCEPLAQQTAARIVHVLNEYPELPLAEHRIGPALYDWDQRLQEEMDLYEELFEQ